MTTDFDITAVRRRLSKEAYEVLELAESLGYSLDWASNKQQAITLRSGFDDRRLLLPATSINANRLRALGTQIIRHADPEKVADASDMTRISERNRRAGKIPLTFDIVTDNDIATKRGGMPLPPPVERALNEARLIQQEEEAREEDARIIRDANDDDEQVAELVEAERVPSSGPDDVIYRGGDTSVHLVSETPWMVRRGGHEGGAGRMYESPSVIHRVWSDGGEDYRCRYCEYESENPRGVAAHASRTKTGHPTAKEAVEEHRVAHYQPTDIKRPMSAVRRLTSELIHALDGIPDWQAMTPDELAHALAEHVYAARPDQTPAEPLTAEQIIHRITLMVDSGRLAEMHQQVEAMAAEMREAAAEREALSVQAAELQERVESLTAERRALRDLLTVDDDDA